MIDFANVPETVQKLATGCLLQNVGPKELVALAPPDAIAVVENFGLSVFEYIEALKWVSDYHAQHAEALKRCAAGKRQ
jgi:hypothetical protein